MAFGDLIAAPAASPTSLLVSAVLGAPGVTGRKLSPVSKGGVTDLIRSIIVASKTDSAKEPFYVFDLGVVVGLYEQWHRRLNCVRPFYAVKCNPEPALLGAMAALGAGFDCASRAEIEAVLALGVTPDRIVYANPCKAESHIRYAAAAGVNLTTFDSAAEVDKIRRWHPDCELLLRIKAPGDDAGARCPLGPKFGALPDEVEPLLRAARDAGLAVVGISFHIGSGGEDTSHAYRDAISAARASVDAAAGLGMPPMRILNIGGGFTAGKQFEEASGVIKSALREHFPTSDADPDWLVMAEPGRFFAERAFTLAANIIGKRVRGKGREYWINDGVYGSMNCILYDHAELTAAPMAVVTGNRGGDAAATLLWPSTVFGPTCDALDTVLTGFPLPELTVGDWLVFPNMGAYTAAAGSNFNGFATSAIPTYLAYSCEDADGDVYL